MSIPSVCAGLGWVLTDEAEEGTYSLRDSRGVSYGPWHVGPDTLAMLDALPLEGLPMDIAVCGPYATGPEVYEAHAVPEGLRMRYGLMEEPRSLSSRYMHDVVLPYLMARLEKGT